MDQIRNDSIQILLTIQSIFWDVFVRENCTQSSSASQLMRETLSSRAISADAVRFQDEGRSWNW